MPIRSLALTSSAIAAAWYDDSTAELTVRLHEGYSYRYFLVPKDVVDALETADSAGRFFGNEIRTVYPWQRVENATRS